MVNKNKNQGHNELSDPSHQYILKDSKGVRVVINSGSSIRIFAIVKHIVQIIGHALNLGHDLQRERNDVSSIIWPSLFNLFKSRCEFDKEEAEPVEVFDIIVWEIVTVVAERSG